MLFTLLTTFASSSNADLEFISLVSCGYIESCKDNYMIYDDLCANILHLSDNEFKMTPLYNFKGELTPRFFISNHYGFFERLRPNENALEFLIKNIDKIDGIYHSWGRRFFKEKYVKTIKGGLNFQQLCQYLDPCYLRKILTKISLKKEDIIDIALSLFDSKMGFSFNLVYDQETVVFYMVHDDAKKSIHLPLTLTQNDFKIFLQKASINNYNSNEHLNFFTIPFEFQVLHDLFENYNIENGCKTRLFNSLITNETIKNIFLREII